MLYKINDLSGVIAQIMVLFFHYFYNSFLSFVGKYRRLDYIPVHTKKTAIKTFCLPQNTEIEIHMCVAKVCLGNKQTLSEKENNLTRNDA